MQDQKQQEIKKILAREAEIKTEEAERQQGWGRGIEREPSEATTGAEDIHQVDDAHTDVMQGKCSNFVKLEHPAGEGTRAIPLEEAPSSAGEGGRARRKRPRPSYVEWCPSQHHRKSASSTQSQPQRNSKNDWLKHPLQGHSHHCDLKVFSSKPSLALNPCFCTSTLYLVHDDKNQTSNPACTPTSTSPDAQTLANTCFAPNSN